MRKLWWRLFGEPVWINQGGVIKKGRMRRIDSTHVIIIFKEYYTKCHKCATMDGKIEKSYNAVWLPRDQYPLYNSGKVLSKIIACKQILPTLMGIDDDLDAIISKELQKGNS